jgi:L-ascorbate metabolism protein UlaG (beta-lactamase superfamily)
LGVVGDQLTFLGHSTVLIDLDGTRVLTDPVFGSIGAGVIRRHVPAVEPGGLVDVAAVFISHGHWDHLDLASLRALPGRPVFIVPVGLGRIVARSTRADVHELKVGEKVRIGTLTVEAIHAEHSRRRSLFTTSEDALGALITGPARIYFAGDTELFEDMARLAGRVDVALLPVGGWGPRLGSGHMGPSKAAEATMRVRPSIAIPIHWGTLYPLGARRARRRHFEGPGEAFRGAVAACNPAVQVRILEPGESMPLEASVVA